MIHLSLSFEFSWNNISLGYFFFPETRHKTVQSNYLFPVEVSVLQSTTLLKIAKHQQNERKKCSILLHFPFYVKINKSLKINFSIFLYFLIIRTKKYPTKHKHTKHIHTLPSITKALVVPLLFLWKNQIS